MQNTDECILFCQKMICEVATEYNMFVVFTFSQLQRIEWNRLRYITIILHDNALFRKGQFTRPNT